ncbi:MAG: HNH endonuclease [Patescibacteria group bacterium]|nr:HNH endonuclease [Patescibacteria group bacterium]
MKRITQQRLKYLFEYDPLTGALIHKHGYKKGRRAGYVSKQGYRSLKIDARTVPSGVVVWIYVTGKAPKHQIDHINMMRGDDRFENLREATRSQNCTNRIRAKNSTGFRGVKRNKNRYMAGLVKEQKAYHFGTFDSAEEAARVYDKYAKKYFGEFAILNFPDKPQRDWLYV